MMFKPLSGNQILPSDFNFTSEEFLRLENWRIKKIQHPTKSTHVYQLYWDRNEKVTNNTIHDSLKTFRNDLIYLQMAKSWSKNSHCNRMKVGCLMVKDKSIISDGYNGSPTGFPNICEDEEMTTLP